MEASAEPCVAGESPWAASSAQQLLLPGAIQSPALCHHPPLPHRYPSSPLRAFCQPSTGFPPSQRGLQWCSACANRAHTQCPPWAPTWGWWVGEILKGAKRPGGVHSAGGGCEQGDSVPRAPHPFSGEPHPPCCSCSSTPSRWQQHLSQTNPLISVVTLLNQCSPGCFCISCWNKGWR